MYLIPIVFFPEIYGAFSLFIFCSLILAFPTAKSKKIKTMKKNFHPNEGKTSMIFHQPDLVYDSTTSYFFKVSRIIRRVHIVYVIESAAYGVLFTSCLYQKPEQARYERERAFDTNNE